MYSCEPEALLFFSMMQTEPPDDQSTSQESSSWEVRCRASQSENAVLKARCAALEAENARLLASIGRDQLPCESHAGKLLSVLQESPLDLSGSHVAPENFSTKGHLFDPPLDLQDIVRHDPSSSWAAASGGRSSRSGTGSARELHGLPCALRLECLTRNALEEYSRHHDCAIGLGVYQHTGSPRSSIDLPCGHSTAVDGYQVGPIKFYNRVLMQLHDEDDEVALAHLLHTVDHHDAFRRALQGLLRNVLRGDTAPVTIRRLFRLHTSPSVMAFTYLYPCSYYDGTELHELAYLMVCVPQSVGKGLMENLMHDHIALKFAAAMMTTVDNWGHVVAQNSASFGALGFHGRDHRRLGPEQTEVHYLKELFHSDVEAYESMLVMTARGFGSTFKIVLQITSPVLLYWLSKTGQEVWHEIQVSIMPHPVYSDHVYIVSQSDVTATMVAQRHVEQWQQLQRDLLGEILPPQVADKLLRQSSCSIDERASDGAMGTHCLSRSVSGLPDLRYRTSSTGGVGSTGSTGASTSPLSGGGAQSKPASGLSMDQLLIQDDEPVGLTRRDVMSLSTYHEQVTILFTDIVGFTGLSQQLHPSDVMLMLNNLYSIYDHLCEVYDVYKVETIGDSFMAAGGLFSVGEDGGRSHQHLGGYDPQHASKVLNFARALLAATEHIRTPLGTPVSIRVGIHSGPCMSGVVGLKMPRFCLFGDTINMASRMESTGQPGAIHVSQAMRDLLPHEPWQSTGGVHAKGKGLVQSFVLAGGAPLSPSRSLVAKTLLDTAAHFLDSEFLSSSISL